MAQKVEVAVHISTVRTRTHNVSAFLFFFLTFQRLPPSKKFKLLFYIKFYTYSVYATVKSFNTDTSPFPQYRFLSFRVLCPSTISVPNNPHTLILCLEKLSMLSILCLLLVAAFFYFQYHLTLDKKTISEPSRVADLGYENISNSCQICIR